MKEHKLFASLLGLLLLVLIAFVGVKTWNAYASHAEIGHEPRGRDTITIDGEGKVTGKPTLAQIDIGLYSEGRDVPQVQKDNTQKVNAIVDAMKELGIADADLQTSNYSIYPKFDYNNNVQTVNGYVVSQSLHVKVRDLTNVGTALAKVGSLGANQVNGVTFTIDDPKELKQQARMKALEDAKKKAQELADALGVNVVRVVTFSESSGSPGPMPFNYRAMDSGVAAAPAPDIQSGSLDVMSNVSVTFEIR